MAKKLPPEMEPTKWEVNKSGNPGGRPKLKPIQKQLREITIDSLGELLMMAFNGNLADLQARMKDPKMDVLQVAVAHCLIIAIKKGDWNTIEKILERIIGKVPDYLYLTANSKSEVDLAIEAPIDKDKLRLALKEIQEDV